MYRTPYNTKYGKLKNVVGIVKLINEYLINIESKGSLGYEYLLEGDTKLIIITGCSDKEKEIPLWDHPIDFVDHKGNKYIALDLRQYVRPAKEMTLTIDEIAKDKTAVKFQVLRAMIMSMFLNDRAGLLRNNFSSIITGYTLVLSNILDNIITLSPSEKMYAEIVIAYQANLMLNNQDSIDLEVAKNRIKNAKLTFPTNSVVIDNVFGMMDLVVPGIDTMFSNIAKVISPDKKEMFSLGVVVSVLNNSWYGPGNSESVIIGLEDIATFIALLYINNSDRIYKRTRLGSLIEKHSVKMKAPELVKAIDNILKENTIS